MRRFPTVFVSGAFGRQRKSVAVVGDRGREFGGVPATLRVSASAEACGIMLDLAYHDKGQTMWKALTHRGL